MLENELLPIMKINNENANPSLKVWICLMIWRDDYIMTVHVIMVSEFYSCISLQNFLPGCLVNGCFNSIDMKVSECESGIFSFWLINQLAWCFTDPSLGVTTGYATHYLVIHTILWISAALGTRDLPHNWQYVVPQVLQQKVYRLTRFRNSIHRSL